MDSTRQKQGGQRRTAAPFSAYLMKYKGILLFDLFCAALTTLCDIVLPKIMGVLTNAASGQGAALTVQAV